MRRTLLLLMLGALANATACKRRPSYDQSTPEAALESFAAAINAARIPDDIEQLVSDPREIASWKLRCKAYGCRRAKLEVKGRGETSDYAAILYVDYAVEGSGGEWVIRGKRSPIHFARKRGRWFIEQFGEQITTPRRRVPAALGRDAGAGRPPGAADTQDEDGTRTALPPPAPGETASR